MEILGMQLQMQSDSAIIFIFSFSFREGLETNHYYQQNSPYKEIYGMLLVPSQGSSPHYLK